MIGEKISLIRYDAIIYSRALGARTPGTHNLHLVEKADHNFTKVNLDSYRRSYY